VATGEWLVVLRKSEEAVTGPVRNQLYTVFALMGLGLLVVVGVSLWITTTTARRIRRAVAAADRVALGDLSTSSEIVTDARDETALLSHSFNRLVESYRDITQICVAIANGDFSKSFAKRSEADTLAETNRRLDRIVKKAKKLQTLLRQKLLTKSHEDR